METNKILEGNKILAEFMGGKLDSPDSKHYYFIERGRYESELFYHSSWDWLMPVVGKITNQCEEPDELYGLIYALLWNDIEGAWQFVVDYLDNLKGLKI